MKKVNTRTLAGLGLMTAIVIVLQLVGGAIRFGTFSISLVLLPIVVGAALYGRGAGWDLCSVRRLFCRETRRLFLPSTCSEPS